MTHLVERMEPRQLFAGGAIDTTFGTAGTVDLLFKVARGEIAHVDEVAADPSGRTYVAAFTQTNGKSEHNTLQVRRLDAVGALDGTFARSRSNNLLFPLDATGQPLAGHSSYDIAVDFAGRLLVAVGSNLYRFNVDGTLDGTFADRGTARLPANARAAQLALDPAGRIHVVGSLHLGAGQTQAVVARFTPEGRLDTGFRQQGSYAVPFQAPAAATSPSSAGARIRVLDDGSVHVLTAASYRTTEADVIHYTFTGTQSLRLTAGGMLDTAYGDGGFASYYQRSGDVAFYRSHPLGIRSDGSVLLYEGGATDDPNGAGSLAQNRVISRDGNSGGRATFGPQSNVLGSDRADAVDFIRQADGSEIFVSDRPGALFMVAANGAYNFDFNDGEIMTGVTNAALQPDGTLVTARDGTIRNRITLSRIFRDDAPVATSSVRPIRAATTSTRFNVVYRAPGGVDSQTITGQELRLVQEDNPTTRRPRLVSKTVLDDGSVLAVYKTTDLTGHAWDSTDNGAYAIRVLPDLVKSQAGIAMGRRTVGILSVRIA